MQDKIALLMEETGCDQGEAELALEMCGYEVEKAVKAIPRLHKDIVILKARVRLPDRHHFGLLLVVLNARSRALLRSRAVLSYNPAVFTVPLERDWFEFEKALFGCRLWEGSLQAESQDLEQALAEHYRTASSSPAFSRSPMEPEILSKELGGVVARLHPGAAPEVQVRQDILDLGSFQSLRGGAEAPAAEARAKRRAQPSRADETLILKVALEEDPQGVPVLELRAGDIVSARIVDARDIAQYLSKLLGGYSEAGPQPIPGPVEAIESGPGEDMLVRVRFAVGACGDAEIKRGARVRVSRATEREAVSWWRRFFK
jgi:hypothetical protein